MLKQYETREPVELTPVDRIRGDPQPEATPLEHAIASLLALTDSLRRRLPIFFAIFAISGSLMLLAIALQTPLYESTAYLLVKFGREHVYRAETSGNTSFAPRTKETILNSEIVIVRSAPVLEAVVSEFGVDRIYPDLMQSLAADFDGAPTDKLKIAVAADELREDIKVQALAGADVIQIAFKHAHPNTAAEVVNLTIDKLIEKHVEVFGDNEVVDFFETRVASFRAALEEAEARLNSFESIHEPFVASENAASELLERRSKLENDLRRQDSQIAAVRLRNLERRGAVSDAELELLDLRIDEQRLEGSLKRRVQDRIEVLSRFLATRENETQREIGGLQSQRDATAAEIRDVGAQVGTLPGLSSEHRALLRERDSIEEQYETYLQRLHEARISNEMDRAKLASIRVIQQAVPALKPSSPFNPALQMAAALVIALILGFLGSTLFDALSSVLERRRQAAV